VNETQIKVISLYPSFSMTWLILCKGIIPQYRRSFASSNASLRQRRSF
jgi:hypothetical protein